MRAILFSLLTSIILFFNVAHAEEIPFAERSEVKLFIQEMVEKNHFNENELHKLFNAVTIRPTVMNKMNAPLEQRPWHTYQMLFVTEWRIRNGVEFWNKHQTILNQAEKQYGVPASIIIATIAVESKFGQHTGEFPVIDALTNIGFSQSPRAPFFRSELEQFLLLSREQALNPREVMGSYAGAIGQPQFMPSSYRRYAVSYSGKQKIDLSHNEADIIFSIANYYKNKGWETNAPVATPASQISEKFDIYRNAKGQVEIISKSKLSGFETNDKDKPNRPYNLTTLRNDWDNEYWYTFHNFDVIKRYNASDLYAMAVFQLSRYISMLKEKTSEV